jgi:hypothetical protein
MSSEDVKARNAMFAAEHPDRSVETGTGEIGTFDSILGIYAGDPDGKTRITVSEARRAMTAAPDDFHATTTITDVKGHEHRVAKVALQRIIDDANKVTYEDAKTRERVATNPGTDAQSPQLDAAHREWEKGQFHYARAVTHGQKITDGDTAYSDGAGFEVSVAMARAALKFDAENLKDDGTCQVKTKDGKMVVVEKSDLRHMIAEADKDYAAAHPREDKPAAHHVAHAGAHKMHTKLAPLPDGDAALPVHFDPPAPISSDPDAALPFVIDKPSKHHHAGTGKPVAGDALGGDFSKILKTLGAGTTVQTLETRFESLGAGKDEKLEKSKVTLFSNVPPRHS